MFQPPFGSVSVHQVRQTSVNLSSDSDSHVWVHYGSAFIVSQLVFLFFGQKGKNLCLVFDGVMNERPQEVGRDGDE